MNYNRLSAHGPERKLAAEQDLTVLRDRIDNFVQTYGPKPTFPKDTLIYDSGLEPARHLVSPESGDMSINVGFSGECVAEIAPDAAQRLEIAEIIFSRDVPTYQYRDGPLPTDTAAMSNEDIFDGYWMHGCGSSIYIGKKPGSRFEAAFYKLSVNGETVRMCDSQSSGPPYPLSSEAPMTISQQELEDFNTILDALDALSPGQRAQQMKLSIDS